MKFLGLNIVGADAVREPNGLVIRAFLRSYRSGQLDRSAMQARHSKVGADVVREQNGVVMCAFLRSYSCDFNFMG